MVAVGHPTVNLTLPSPVAHVVRDFDAYSHLPREGDSLIPEPPIQFLFRFRVCFFNGSEWAVDPREVGIQFMIDTLLN